MRFYLLLFCTFFLGSCQKKLASFNPSHSETFETVKVNALKHAPEIGSSAVAHDAAERGEILAMLSPLSSQSKVLKVKVPAIAEPISKNVIIFKKNNDAKVEKLSSQEHLKKKHRRNRFFNDSIKIGLSFLLIAIVLALLSLGQLSLLFGVASIVFLYIGLKKYYRRQRLRKLFT